MRSGLCVKQNLQWMLKNASGRHMPSQAILQFRLSLDKRDFRVKWDDRVEWFILFYFLFFFFKEVYGGQVECHVYKSSAQKIYYVMSVVWRRESEICGPRSAIDHTVHVWSHFTEGSFLESSSTNGGLRYILNRSIATGLIYW